MVCEALDIEKETYLAILMDREAKGPVIVASPEGGMDIEEVAEKSPEKILTVSHGDSIFILFHSSLELNHHFIFLLIYLTQNYIHVWQHFKRYFSQHLAKWIDILPLYKGFLLNNYFYS